MLKRMQKFLSVSEKSLFWLVIFLLVFIPLYPKFPLLNVRGTFVAIRLEDVLITLALIWWGVWVVFSGRIKEFFADQLNQAILLFFFIGAFSLFSAVFLTHTVLDNLGLFHYLRRVEMMMLLPMAATTLRTRRQLTAALVTLSGVVFLVSIYALGQRYLDWPVVSTTNSEFSKGLILYLTPGARVSSTFAGHYDLAVFLAMIIVMFTAALFSLKVFLWKAWSLFLMGLSFIVLVMTAARLSFVAAVTGVIVSLVLAGKKWFILLMVLLSVVSVIYPSQLRDRLVSTLTVNIQKEGQRYIAERNDQNARQKLNIPTLMIAVSSESAGRSRQVHSTASATPSDITPGEPVDPTQLGVYRSFGIRFNLEWPRAIRAFMKNPFLGTGYSSLGLATDNDFLRSLGEVGILGTIALCLVLVEITKRIWVVYRSGDRLLKYFSAGVLSMIFAFILNALFIDVFEATKVASLFWLIIGLNLAAGKFK